MIKKQTLKTVGDFRRRFKKKSKILQKRIKEEIIKGLQKISEWLADQMTTCRTYHSFFFFFFNQANSFNIHRTNSACPLLCAPFFLEVKNERELYFIVDGISEIQ